MIRQFLTTVDITECKSCGNNFTLACAYLHLFVFPCAAIVKVHIQLHTTQRPQGLTFFGIIWWWMGGNFPFSWWKTETTRAAAPSGEMPFEQLKSAAVKWPSSTRNFNLSPGGHNCAASSAAYGWHLNDSRNAKHSDSICSMEWSQINLHYSW